MRCFRWIAVLATILDATPGCRSTPARPPDPAAPRVAVGHRVDLGIPARFPAWLSPSGKQVLYVQPERDRYAYWIVDAAGRRKARLFDVPLGTDEARVLASHFFPFCLGHGAWAPDGTRFSALIIRGGPPVHPEMVTYDLLRRRFVRLPRKLWGTIGAVFGADGAVYYLDAAHPEPRAVLRRYDPATGRAEELLALDGRSVVSLTLSPDRRLLGAFLVGRRSRSGGRFRSRLWVRDLATGRTVSSGSGTGFRFRGRALFWDADGSALYAARAGRAGRSAVARFAPFAPVKKRTAFLLKGRGAQVGAAFAPGVLSVVTHAAGSGRARARVLDVAADRAPAHDSGLWLVDRQGDAGLFVDVRTQTYGVGRILPGPKPASPRVTPRAAAAAGSSE